MKILDFDGIYAMRSLETEAVRMTVGDEETNKVLRVHIPFKELECAMNKRGLVGVSDVIARTLAFAIAGHVEDIS